MTREILEQAILALIDAYEEDGPRVNSIVLYEPDSKERRYIRITAYGEKGAPWTKSVVSVDVQSPTPPQRSP